MSIQVFSQLQPAMETILFLERAIAQSEGVESVIHADAQSISEKCHIPFSELESLAEPLRNFEEDLRSVLLPREDLWGNLFYPGSDQENRLAWGFYFLDHSGTLDRPGPFPLHHLLMGALEDTSLSMETVESLEKFVAYLSSRTCSDRTKWIFTQVWQHPERIYQQFKALVNLSEPVVARHNKVMHVMTQAALQRVSEVVKRDPSALSTELGIAVTVPETLVILPTAIHLKNIGFIWDSAAGREDAAYLVVGILRQPVQNLMHRYANSSEFLAERLKSLSDQRRLEILKALKVKPRYGQELAEMLGLTPATISHHMNSLVSEGFVTVDRQGVRGNYSLNEKNLDSFLQSLRASLL